MTPELRARQQIDLLLQQSGWIVQDRSQTNLAAGPGVAIREALLKTGEADYLLFAGGKAIATVRTQPTKDERKQIGRSTRMNQSKINALQGVVFAKQHQVLIGAPDGFL